MIHVKMTIPKKKRPLIWLLLCLWLGILVTVIVLTAAKSVSASPRKLPVYSVERSDKKIALTFDCAWGDETTDAILELLKKRNVRATFFFVGTFAEQFPESVKKIDNAGHTIGNHSMKHKDPTVLSYAEVLEEISSCNELLRSLTGKEITLYRAPSGSYDNQTIEAAASLGMTAVQWSTDSIDWKHITPEKMIDRVCSKVFPGAILLFHLGTENTLEALPAIIRNLQAEHYEFVTVPELLLQGESYIDSAGKQRPAKTDKSEATAETATDAFHLLPEDSVA